MRCGGIGDGCPGVLDPWIPQVGFQLQVTAIWRGCPGGEIIEEIGKKSLERLKGSLTQTPFWPRAVGEALRSKQSREPSRAELVHSSSVFLWLLRGTRDPRGATAAPVLPEASWDRKWGKESPSPSGVHCMLV